MQELLTMFGALAPDEMLIEQLEKGLQEYRETGDLEKLGLPCMLLLSKLAAKENGGVKGLLEELEKNRAAQNLLDQGEN